MELSKEEKNKNIVRESFEAVFNKRDLDAFEKYWSPDYIQHSAHIPPGRDGLKMLVESLPAEARYDSSVMMAEGDFVMVHGRYTGIPGPNWIVVDIIRLENGKLAEHWDVIQDEATQESSKSGLPMYKEKFGVK
jgi:predicted SnoaL-like aldol condensation-catalyzing enzyme